MPQTIPYMGTKKYLSGAVLKATGKCKNGRVVDLFAGMGSVAEAHEGVRQVWANDAQHFAALNNKCRLTQPCHALGAKIDGNAEAIFLHNMECLREQESSEERLTLAIQSSSNYDSFSAAFRSARELKAEFRKAYCCFSNRYAFSYFSLHQCFEIDSIRYLLEYLRGIGEINQSDFDWGILSLGAAMLRCANTTGHFAQFMKPNSGNWRRVQRQYRKSIWCGWKTALSELKPFGTPQWREGNIVTRNDALDALRNSSITADVGVVYCDPPYTNDQYSRFYHLWESLVLYDYPEVTGAGLYRSGRFVTDFSSIRRVSSAFDQLSAAAASIGADVVLSYPSNGLLHDAGYCPLQILGEYFKETFVSDDISYSHSSMGASKGPQKNQVIERVYVARHAR